MLLGALLSSCAAQSAERNADRTRTTRNFTVGNFTGIDVATGIHVTYTPGKLTPASVTAPAYVFDYLELKVSDGDLKIKIDESYFRHFRSLNDPIVVTVSAPVVSEYEASSGSSITVQGDLKINGKCDIEVSSGASFTYSASLTAGTLDVETSSGASASFNKCRTGKIDLEASSAGSVTFTNVVTDLFNAEASSGASVSAVGQAKKLNCEVSSGASFNGKALVASKAVVESSSGGSVDYNAAVEVTDVDITGSARNHHK